jgi:hypothetical protein
MKKRSLGVLLGGESFATQVAAKKRAREIRDTGELGPIERSNCQFVFDWVKNHPKVKEHLNDKNTNYALIRQLSNDPDYQNGKEVRTLAVIVPSFEEPLTVSIEKCCSSVFKPMVDVSVSQNERARRLVAPDTLKFKKDSFGVNKKTRCSDCRGNFSPDEVDVDHFDGCFKDIFSDFRAHGDIKDDDVVLPGWRGYHAKRAKLQILCKQCHKNKRKRV